jgi:ATP-dependent helicase/nuclease subunit A
VRPEGVVAITYTKKAAAELQSRIRTALIRAGRADLAARVRDGYPGTVHSVCERLLRELALEAGHSPWLEPIAESSARSSSPRR